MTDHVFALIIKGESEVFESLHLALKGLPIQTYAVRTISEAGRLITQTEPKLIFTATYLPDGSWVDVVRLVERSEITSNVIVVAPAADVKLHLSAMDRGAFDFIVPPFDSHSLGYVIRSAQLDVTHRKADLMREALAS